MRRRSSLVISRYVVYDNQDYQRHAHYRVYEHI
jgi:hypothetical protein